MTRKKITVPLSEFKDDEPRYGRWTSIFHHGPPLWVSSQQVCKVICRFGNDIDGWRYIVEYKFTEGNERFSPPCFHIEPATEEEWNKQEPTVYFPQQNKRRWQEYNALPESYIRLSSGDWYEIEGENVPDQLKGRVGWQELQDFCEERMEFSTERHIINLLTSLGLKVKRVGAKKY